VQRIDRLRQDVVLGIDVGIPRELCRPVPLVALRLLVEVAQPFLHVAIAPGVAGVEGREDGLELLVEVLELVHGGGRERHGRGFWRDGEPPTSPEEGAGDVSLHRLLRSGRTPGMLVPARAVIFDVDGVLVDSYDAHMRSWLLMGREHGLAITEQEFASTFGQTSREIIARFWGSHLSAQDVEALDARKQAIYRALIA